MEGGDIHIAKMRRFPKQVDEETSNNDIEGDIEAAMEVDKASQEGDAEDLSKEEEVRMWKPNSKTSDSDSASLEN